MAMSGMILPMAAGASASAIPEYALMAGLGGNMPGGGLLGLTGNQQGGLSSLLSGIFGMGSYNNPADSAMPYLDQIEGKITPNYAPYMDAGKASMPILQQQFGNLLNNPTSVMSMIGNKFQQSPGYQWQMDQGLNAIDRAAAAGGMAGSPMHQQKAATMASNLANQDYYNFMDRGTNMFNQGLSGYSGLGQMGLQASDSLSSKLMDALMSKALLQFQGTNAANQAQGGGIGSIISGVSSFF